MPTHATPEPGGSPAQDDALATAMSELEAERAPMPGEPGERYWLRVGIALGLRQPGRAALLLGGLEAGAAESASGRTAAGPHKEEAEPSPTTIGDQTDEMPAREAAGHSSADSPAADSTADPDEAPVRSRLLARSATLPASAAPATVFGWVEQLSPLEIRRLGLAVTELIARGGPRDLERGFGLAWSAGTRLPHEDLRRLFGRFGELELAVCGVLGSRDLLSITRPPENGVAALLSVFVQRASPAATEASAILEREGEPAKRGLIAIWNAWVALRYRELIGPPLFEQLVEPWVTVLGRLPEP